MTIELNSDKPITYFMNYIRECEPHHHHFHDKGLHQEIIRATNVTPKEWVKEYCAIKKYAEYSGGGIHIPDWHRKDDILFSRIKTVYLNIQDGTRDIYRASSALEETRQAKFELISCICHQDEATVFAEKNNLNVILSECGGQETINELVRKLIGK